MKLRRSVISLLLSVLMVLGCFGGLAVTPAVAAETSAASTGSDDYGLLANPNGSAILHCFCWSANTITANMKAIAEAGFSAIQTSPINYVTTPGSTPYTIGDSSGGAWYYQYQTQSYNLGNYYMGTESEIKKMCQTAESYGVKVIVDITLNHVMNTSAISGISDAYHTYDKRVEDYSNRYEVTQGKQSGLTDVNTHNTNVQNYLINMMKGFIDIGVDGFRFDAAKHIELPAGKEVDSSYASNFWPNVTSALKSYKSDVYLIGEVLHGDNTPYYNYGSYMSVPLDSYGYNIRGQIQNYQLTASTVSDYVTDGLSLSQVYGWIESHDNYCHDYTWGNIDNFKVRMGWAAMMAQNDVSGVFFARPANSSASNIWGDNVMGKAGDGNYFNSEVKAINHFHNAMMGQSPYVENVNGNTQILAIRRGNKGVAILNFSPSDLSLNLSVGLSNGTYTDEAHGGKYTVSNGTLTGTVPAGQIVTIYNGSATPANTEYYLPGDFNSWSPASAMTKSNGVATQTLTLSAGTYKFKISDSNNTWYGNIGTIKDTTETSSPGLGWEMDSSAGDCTLEATGGTYTFKYNYSTHMLIITHSSSGQATTAAPTSTTAPVTVTTSPSGTRTILFTNNQGWSGDIYVYTWGGSTSPNKEWPGVKMTKSGDDGYGNDQYSATVNTDITGLIFNNKSKQTVDIDYDASAAGWYPTGVVTNGKYEVGSWKSTVVEPTEAPTTVAPTTTSPATTSPATTTPSGTRTVLFTNNQGWSGDIYVYTWGGSTSPNKEWPGVKMTKSGDDGYGNDQYSATVNTDITGLIFNNKSKQTVDIDYDSTAAGWYPTGKTDSKGHYEVESWKSTVVEPTEAPTTEPPTTEPPTTEPPTTEPPTTEPPTTEPPTTEPPTTEPATADPNAGVYLYDSKNNFELTSLTEPNPEMKLEKDGDTYSRTFEDVPVGIYGLRLFEVKDDGSVVWHPANQDRFNTVLTVTHEGTSLSVTYTDGGAKGSFTLDDPYAGYYLYADSEITGVEKSFEPNDATKLTDMDSYFTRTFEDIPEGEYKLNMFEITSDGKTVTYPEQTVHMDADGYALRVDFTDGLNTPRLKTIPVGVYIYEKSNYFGLVSADTANPLNRLYKDGDTYSREYVVPAGTYSMRLFEVMPDESVEWHSANLDRINKVKTATYDNSILSVSYTAGDKLGTFNITDPELEMGDVNLDGEVDIRDVTLIQKYLVDDAELTDKQKELADLNGDERVTLRDATRLQLFLATGVTTVIQ